MNNGQRNSAPVLARNCEIGCAFFISGDIPRNRSPPDFLEFFKNFKKSEENKCITTWSKAEKESKH